LRWLTTPFSPCRFGCLEKPLAVRKIPTGTHGLRPANVETPDFKGTDQVDQHGRIVRKPCWRWLAAA